MAQTAHSASGLHQFNPNVPDLSDEDSKVLKLGVAAFRRISRGGHREDWLNIGHSLNTLQARAMEAARTNRPVGAHYNGYYAHKHHADGMAQLEKSVRSHAMWMASNWTVVEPWLAALPEQHRLKLNHPATIHRHFDRATNPRDPMEPTDTVHARNVRLRDELDFVKVENDELRIEADKVADLSMEARAARFVKEHEPEDARRYATAILALLDDAPGSDESPIWTSFPSSTPSNCPAI